MGDEQELFRLIEDRKNAEFDVRGGRLAEADLPRFVDLCKRLRTSGLADFSAQLYPAAPNVGGGRGSVYTRIHGSRGDISTYKISRVEPNKLLWKPRRAPGIYVKFNGREPTTLREVLSGLLQFSEKCECSKVDSGDEKWLLEVRFSLEEQQR